jgi:uncharacterized protein (TIGR02285 family)
MGLVAALLAAGSFGGALAEQPTMTWVHPYTQSSENEPPDRAATMEDGVLDWLMSHLPAYRQTVLTATAGRLMALLKSTDGVCYPTLRKTEERLSFIAFSDRLFWALPARVVVAEARAEAFRRYIDPSGDIALDRLLADSSLTGAREKGRAFPPAIEALLDPYAKSGRLIEEAKGQSAYAQLAKARVDWVIGYPTDTRRAFPGDLPRAKERSYAIAGSDEAFEVFAGCSKQPLGRQVIADIDTALQTRPGGHPLQDLYDGWIDEESRAALHQAIARLESTGMQ